MAQDPPAYAFDDAVDLQQHGHRRGLPGRDRLRSDRVPQRVGVEEG